MGSNSRKIKIFGGKKIIIRQLAPKDLKQAEKFQRFINALVAENAKILMHTKKTRKEEVEWIKGVLRDIGKKQEVFLIAECEGAIIGSTHVKLGRERESHVGNFGISVAKNFRGIGLGYYLTKEVIKLAKKELKPRPKIIRLSVYRGNLPALNLYKKVGFQQVALIPKQIQFKGKFINELIMLLDLSNKKSKS